MTPTARASAREIVTVKTVATRSSSAHISHFMQKEIFEQPRAIADTLESVGGIGPELFGAGADDILSDIDAVHMLACGTSYYSGMVARLWLEAVAGIRRRRRSRANTAIATASPIPTRWSS